MYGIVTYLSGISFFSEICLLFCLLEHCDEVGDNIFLLNTKEVPLVSKFSSGLESKALANNLCM